MIERYSHLFLTPEDDVAGALAALARSAQKSISILIYGFTDAALADILICQHALGLTVGVVSDKTQAAGPTQHALLVKLASCGVPVTITTSTHAKISHDKALIVDTELGYTANGSAVAFGSYNFSAGAQLQNNHAIVTNDPTFVERFHQKYLDALAYGQAHPQWQLAAPKESA